MENTEARKTMARDLAVAVRLAVSVGLGGLGAWLMPVQRGFIPHVSAGHHRWALLIWLVAAVLGALLLHHLGRLKVSRRLLLCMVLALLLSLVGIPATGKYDLFDCLSLAKFGAISLLVLLAGLAGSGDGTPGSRVRDAVRGTVFSVVSPLLLLDAGSPAHRSRRYQWIKAGSVAFLCALASPLLSLGRDHVPRFVWQAVNVDGVFLVCRSFSQWAWFGCASLCLLTPWPDVLQVGQSQRRDKRARIRAWTAVGLGAAALAVLALLNWRIFMAVPAYGLLLVYVDAYALVLLLVLTPSGLTRYLPRLAALDRPARVGPVGTVLFLGMHLVPLAMWCSPSIRSLVTGSFLAWQFDTRWLGWTLDQSTLHSGFWRFAALMVPAAAHIVVARWFSDRDSLLGYWAFTVPAVGLCFCLLSYLTSVFYGLLIYIRTHGFTLLRVYALAYGIGCYTLTLAFMRWAVKRPRVQEA